MATGISARLTRHEGRKFAFTVGPAFMLIAGVGFWRGHSWLAFVAAPLGVALSLAGMVLPGRLGPLYRGWMRLALAISRITTPVFLSLVYFGVVLPIGLLRRSLGGNPLVRAEGTSFWIRRADGDRRSDLGRQF
jgi:hypothetical protein